MVRRLAPLTLLVLVACSGGDGTTPSTTTPPPSTPEAEITSHEDGATITGDRTVTVAGTLGDNLAITAVGVEVDGVPVDPAAVTFDQASFSAVVTLGDNANTVEVTATNEADRSGTARLTLTYPFLAVADGQAASVAIGQPDLDTGASSALQDPTGTGLIHDGALYLPDTGQNRVLVYDQVPATSGVDADRVLGQADGSGTTAGTDQDRLSGPQAVAAADGRLLVADRANHRVLVWDTMPAGDGAPADVVVGQPDFVSATGACSRAGLNLASSAVVAAGRLVVADTANHRVLIWNDVPATNGADADLVLGQGGFTTCAYNDKDGDGLTNPLDDTPSERTLRAPTAVWSDGTRLVVADAGNHRVLVWSTFPTESGAPADVVVGQPNFTSYPSGAGRAGLNAPTSVASNGNQLFVADAGNHRVLVWDDLAAIATGAEADRVLGQPDFTSVEANRGLAAPTAQTLSHPAGVHPFGGTLLVTDRDNHRFLLYEPQ